MEQHCECGERLPTHLLDVDLPDMDPPSHVCSCERAYEAKEGRYVCVGRKENPFARYDQEAEQ